MYFYFSITLLENVFAIAAEMFSSNFQRVSHLAVRVQIKRNLYGQFKTLQSVEVLQQNQKSATKTALEILQASQYRSDPLLLSCGFIRCASASASLFAKQSSSTKSDVSRIECVCIVSVSLDNFALTNFSLHILLSYY